MKALLIVGAIVSAWVSGVGAMGYTKTAHNGAAALLVLAVVCGMAAWVW